MAEDKRRQPGADARRAGTGGRRPAGTGERRPSDAGERRPSEADAKELRRAQLTSRAAILAVVACAIALSLAYPVREYIAQRREIAQLHVQQRQAQQQVEQLAQQKQRLGNESYVRRKARERLYMCDPGAKCYVVLGGGQDDGPEAGHKSPPPTPPWYITLWRSVDAANRRR
jgi:cell division protein FtsB